MVVLSGSGDGVGRRDVIGGAEHAVFTRGEHAERAAASEAWIARVVKRVPPRIQMGARQELAQAVRAAGVMFAPGWEALGGELRDEQLCGGAWRVVDEHVLAIRGQRGDREQERQGAAGDHAGEGRYREAEAGPAPQLVASIGRFDHMPSISMSLEKSSPVPGTSSAPRSRLQMPCTPGGFLCGSHVLLF